MNQNELTKHDHVLLGLVFSLQAGAMQQLGKVTDPVSGELARDLDSARTTIDILEMLKVKCRSETPEPVLQVLDTAVMELQMNYLDEMKKDRAAAAREPAEEPAEKAAAQDGEDSAEAAAAPDENPDKEDI